MSDYHSWTKIPLAGIGYIRMWTWLGDHPVKVTKDDKDVCQSNLNQQLPQKVSVEADLFQHAGSGL